jgi:Ca2+-binding RTX toxin-like protein
MSITLSVQSFATVENTASGFGAGQIEVVVSLSAPSTQQVQVDYRLRDGSAGDDDLLYLSNWFRNFGTLTFAAGETEQSFFIETRPDTDVEPTEAFAIELFNPSGASFETGGPILHSLGLILDDDGPSALEPEVFVTAPIAVMDGPNSQVHFDIHLSHPAPSDLQFSYETDGLSGDQLSGQITVAAGHSTAKLTLPVAATDGIEGLKTLGLRLTSITDPDASIYTQAHLVQPASSPLPTMVVLGDAGLENVGPVDGRLGFTVVLSEPSETPITVEYYLSGGTADDTDVNLPFSSLNTPRIVTFAAGETVKTVSVTLQTDSLPEPDESFSLHLINPTGAQFADGHAEISALGVILDNDGASNVPVVFIKDAVIQEDGDGHVAVFAVSLSRPASEPLTVTYQTQDGTLVSGVGFAGQTGQVTFEAGQMHSEVRIPLLGDTDTPQSGQFFLTGTLVPEHDAAHPFVTAQAIVEHFDPSAPPALTVRGLDTIWSEQSDAVARFVISLNQVANETVSVAYTLNSQGAEDPTLDGLMASSGVATFAAGQTSQIIEIRLRDPSSVSADTALWLELFDPSGATLYPSGHGTQALSVLRIDPDTTAPPQVFVTQRSVQTDASGDQVVMVDVRLSRPAEAQTQVFYASHDGSALAGQDYTSVSGNLIFEAGQDRMTVSVPLLSSVTGETVLFSAGLGGQDDLTWTTLNLPIPHLSALPVISVSDASVLENTGLGSNDLTFGIALSAPSDEVVSLSYEAVLGTASANDFIPQHMSGTVTFQPGQTRVSLPFTTAFDATAEPDETLFLHLSAPVNGVFGTSTDTTSAVGFVIDDDGGTQVTLAAPNAQVIEGQTALVAVHLSQALLQDTTFAITLTEGTASISDIETVQETLTFLAGQTLGYVSLSAHSDAITEGRETLTLTLVETQPATATAPIQTTITVDINEAGQSDPSDPVVQSGSALDDILNGGLGDDLLSGLGGDDEIFGAAGNDFLTPGLGSDMIDGGAGTDTISFVDAALGVSIDMTTGHATSGTDTDTWINIENITGSIYGDFIRTDEGDNRIRALGNYDWIVGSDGSDVIDGGDGRDMLSYVYAPDAVVVDLGAGRGISGQAEGDRFTNIERLTGSVYSDRFLGSDGADDFRGLGGNDWFVGSDGGRDRYDGGTGRDTVAYDLSTSGVTASLTAGIYGSGQAAQDLYTSIENLTGSSHNDLLIGDAGRNTLRGLYGEDHLEGRGGNDRLAGGALDDILDGGAGWDVAVFEANASEYAVTQNNDVTQVTALGASREGTDTLIDIEAIQFADTLIFL